MKKVLFCLSLIFSLLVLNRVPSFAMEFTISPEVIGGLGDLGYGLIGGAEFDFDGTDYVIKDYDNLSEVLKAQAAEQKAREFLQAYCMARGIPIPNIDPDLPATTGKEFYKSQYFDSANRTVWNNYKLGRTTIEQQEALRFPISPQAFNDWTGYSSFWYQKYIDSFNNDVVVPDIPAEYVPFLEAINGNSGDGHDFFWQEYGFYTFNEFRYYCSSKSWFVPHDYANNSSYRIIDQNFRTKELCQSNNGIMRLDITGSDDSYSLLLSNASILDRGNGLTWASTITQNNISNRSASIGSSGWSNGILIQDGTITNILNYLVKNFRNIDIYLNNDPLSIVSDSAPANPTIPSFPDVLGGNDDDPIPAYDIVFPNTSDYEGTFDITSLFDALKEAIIGASDSDDSTDSTLTRERVTDTYKDKVGEAVGEAVKTIDDVMEDSFPLEGTLNYPNLPPIPMLPLDNAFAGTTILSELIDACQQILPSPLALAFWGMIFILFIIGLIRILHK